MKKIFLFIIGMFIIFANKFVTVDATKLVYVSGQSLGIKLNTSVEVIGTYGVNYNGKVFTPWKNRINEHDKIVKFNNYDIRSSTDLLTFLNNYSEGEVELSIIRNEELITVNITPIKNDSGKYSLGLYIKDYEMGVGTLSFIDPNTHKFASLGHKMLEEEVLGGSVYKATVKEIILPRGNLAGNKRAEILGDVIGNVSKNLDNGVYGTLIDYNIEKNQTLMEVANVAEVHKGSAYILTSIESTTVESFDIEITDAKPQKSSSIKGLKFKVTDDDLLKRAGGIVQGMSGSPIIQDGKIIGAVTHVVLKDASLGYGCYASFMYDTMME